MAGIHEAVSLNRPHEVEALVKAGADVNKVDGSGRTPLDLCAITKGVRPPFGEEARLFMAGVLLSLGANPNIADKFGWTLIHSCAWHDDLSLLTMCIRKGGKVNIPNNEKQLPIDLASIRGNSEVVKYLETQSCDIKAQCRSVIRNAMGKSVHRIQELPLPPSLRLFVNHGSPYDGWEATLISDAPWTVEDLDEQSDVTTETELKDFISENASKEFLEENDKQLTEMTDLIDLFRSMYFWEAFKNVNFEEPLARKPRYSMEKVEKK